MLLTRAQLREQIRNGEPAPVYVLYGQETYLRDLAERTIRDRCFGPDEPRDFNEDRFSLADPENIRTAISSAAQLPMMSARRVITVTDARVGSTSASDSLKESFLELVSAYLDDPSPTTVLIIVADELNGTRKMGKLLREKAAAVEFAPLDESELAEWVRSVLRERVANIDDRVLRHIIALVGNNARRLTQEIDKLTTAALSGGKIDVELVDSLVSNESSISNFDLAHHLLRGDRKRSLQTLEKILDDGAEPVALVGLLSYHYRRLLMVKEMIDRNVPRNEAAKAIKLRYSDQEPFFAAARRTDRARLIHALDRLARTDLAIKTSLGGPSPKGSRLQIEMLVCDLSA